MVKFKERRKWKSCVQVNAIAELQQFAQQIQDAGGIDNIASISAAIEAAGGVQQFNAQLSEMTALSSASGGPQKFAVHLQGTWFCFYHASTVVIDSALN